MTAQPILATVNRDEFVGRDAELRDVVYRAVPFRDARGLVIQAAPGAGAGELLRQAYDQLFMRRRDPIPVHFAFKIGDVTAMSTARRFFQTILQQFIAYRRVDPSLCKAPVTFRDLLELAPPGDYELINNLLESFEHAQCSEQDLLMFSFSVPHRLGKEGRTIFPLIDCLAVRPFRDETVLCQELVTAVSKAAGPFVVAGRRRQVANLIHQTDGPDDARADFTHLKTLGENDARRLIDLVARRYGVPTNEPTRDLIVQQLNASPFFMKELIQAAHEAGIQLTSYLKCQKLYVDDVMKGHIKRYFDRLLMTLAPNFQTRRTLLRVLFESASSETGKSSLWAWKKRLGAAPSEFERIIEALHAFELVNSTAAFIEFNSTSQVWMDYLRVQYQLEVATEPRARVVGTTLLETLKRAPETMKKKYRRESSLGLSDLLKRFDCQYVPASLLYSCRFAKAYKGENADVIDAGLEAESDLIRLPQIVHTASALDYTKTPIPDGDRCTVAYGFEAGDYTDENEIVWLVGEVDSEHEASRELTDVWWNKLRTLAAESGLPNVKIWLVAPKGFSDRACELLNELGAYSSSRQQFELLTARVKTEKPKPNPSSGNEYEMVIPMGEDTEVIAAQALDQIARRLKFKPAAINQIKTALVEACINATEHSLSPDRKIYQRFIVEDDKLVVTVASRGVVPAPTSGENGQTPTDQAEGGKTRRGWGLKLIRTLMDEVEFERVDEGTQLKMTKYLK